MRVRELFLPHYVFRPTQAVRRLGRRLRRPSTGALTVTLPWGAPIRCRAQDVIGLSLQQLGVFELGVSEALWRLTDPGELAVDVGANIGQITAILAHRVGARGRVMAFEPNAQVCADLQHNVAVWRMRGARIEVHAVALSDREGEEFLILPAFYEWNQGTAFIGPGPGAGSGDEQMKVTLSILDRFLAGGERAGVLKLDVDGHEAAVLRGALQVLAEHRVRDVVYESHAGYPDESSAVLEDAGYQVYAVGSGFWGPRCRPAHLGPIAAPWDSPSYLATLEPQRAMDRLQPRGWSVL